MCRNPLGQGSKLCFGRGYAFYSFFAACAAFYFPLELLVVSTSVVVSRVVVTAAQHDQDEAFYQRYTSTDMIVVFRSFESGKTIMMCNVWISAPSLEYSSAMPYD